MAWRPSIAGRSSASCPSRASVPILEKNGTVPVNVSIPLIDPVVALLGYGVLGLSPIAAHIPYFSQLYFFAASAIMMIHRNISLKAIGFTKPACSLTIVYTILFAILPIALFGITEFFLTYFYPVQMTQTAPFLVEGKRAFNLFILAPLSEELLFRGILFSALCRVYPLTYAVTASALLFMLAHGIWAFGPLCLGLIAAIMTYRWQSLIPGIIFHSVSNLYFPLLVGFFPKTYAIVLRLPILMK